MRKTLCALLLLGASACATTAAPAAAPPPAEQLAKMEPAAPVDLQAAAICERFAAPARAAELLAPAFLAAVPAPKVEALFAEFRQKAGDCVGVKRKEGNETAAKYELQFAEGYGVAMSLTVDAQAPHQVVGLWLGNPVRAHGDLQAIVDEVRKLPGAASFYVADLGANGPQPRVAFGGEKPLAIGSAFKLWVLAELARSIDAGEHRWDEVVRLEAEAISLPSGEMQDWPVGTPVTLQTLATMMISRSDNTATDQLVRTLGREKIEATMRAIGHGSPERNVPFLTTRELFLLKGDAGARFLAAEPDERRAIVDRDLAKVPAKEARALSAPTRIGEIEWFASAEDLAKVLTWLRDRGAKDPTVRQILAVNPGLPEARPGRTWVGFKGGSEPGVLNLSYVLESPQGTQLLIATWNDSQANLDEAKFFGLVQRALVLLAPASPAASATAGRAGIVPLPPTSSR